MEIGFALKGDSFNFRLDCGSVINLSSGRDDNGQITELKKIYVYGTIFNPVPLVMNVVG